MKLQLLMITILLFFLGNTLAGEGASLRIKAFDPPEFLPVDEAFVLTASKTGDSVEFHWLVQPGYYLYRDRLSFSGFVGEPELPEGIQKFDEFFGESEVYYDELVITLPVSGNYWDDNTKFSVGYQGCADAGLCYPPQKREFMLQNL